eukprot:423111-Rhodomonas_salina.2
MPTCTRQRREREREREREEERERGRKREHERERENERKRDRDRERGGKRERQRERDVYIYIYIYRERERGVDLIPTCTRKRRASEIGTFRSSYTCVHTIPSISTTRCAHHTLNQYHTVCTTYPQSVPHGVHTIPFLSTARSTAWPSSVLCKSVLMYTPYPSSVRYTIPSLSTALIPPYLKGEREGEGRKGKGERGRGRGGREGKRGYEDLENDLAKVVELWNLVAAYAISVPHIA